MTDEEIQEIIEACQFAAASRGVNIPPIRIDRSEIAQNIAQKGIAILANKSSLMAAKNIAMANNLPSIPDWKPGEVMCISKAVIDADAKSIQAMGIIVHEVGHAYACNLPAGAANTEANAQVFEIETLLHYRHGRGNTIPGNHTYNDQELDLWLANRMRDYLANDPSTSGYVPLHNTIRTLPPVFRMTLSAYHAGFLQHFATHQNRNSKGFVSAMQTLGVLTEVTVHPEVNSNVPFTPRQIRFFSDSKTASTKKTCLKPAFVH